MRPEAAELARFLAGVRRRLLTLRAIEGAAAGLAVAAVVLAMAGRPTGRAGLLTLAALVAAVVGARVLLGDAWRAGWWRETAGLALRVERRAPQARNLILTAAELSARGAVDAHIPGLVMRRAAATAASLAPAALFPSRRAVTGLVAAAVLCGASLARPASVRVAVAPSAADAVPGVRGLTVRVIPPAYAGLDSQRLEDPSRLEVLAGSRLELRVQADADGVELETLAGTQDLQRRDGAWIAGLVAERDGFLALQPKRAAGARGARVLVGLTVTPDRPPRLTLRAPGRDLFFAAVPDTLPVVVEAEDDLGLSSLRLRYTAVAGSGERFTFTERDVPIAVAGITARAWRATGTWRLRDLGLEPGDMVVYRAIATDGRPGAAAASSESYVIEVGTPGAAEAGGYAADDQRDRYAASQQMVILQTERLLAARRALPADSVLDAARRLAAEQRQVRAEFIFMMGGELEDAAADLSGTLAVDETAEAEAEGDVLAGRLENRGRLDLTRAVRAMSRAADLLFRADLDEALRAERVALDNLQRAFSRSRFILRALTRRERIDLERRLSGALADAAGLALPAPLPEPDAVPGALRRLLVEVAARRPGAPPDESARLRAAAATLLRADPTDSTRALVARIESMVGRDAVSAAAWDSLAAALARSLSARLPAVPGRPRPAAADAIEGAWRDARSGRPVRQ